MEIDLKEVVILLWRKIHWIILSAIVGGIIAGCLTYFVITPMYSASASLYVYNTNRANSGITQSDLMASQTLVDTYIVILKSDSVLNKVAEKTQFGYTAEQIRNMLKANSENGTEAFSVTITNKDPAVAQTLVNTLVDVAPSEIVRVVKAGAVEVIDRAALPTEPSSPNMPKNIVIGLFLGLLIAVIAIIVTMLFDTTIHTENDLEEFNIPILGVIPTLGQVDATR